MDPSSIERNGFIVIPLFSSDEEVSVLRAAVADHIKGISEAGVRGIARLSPVVMSFARSIAVKNVVEAVLGGPAKLVRSILFNKSSEVNWLVTWHQDLSIAVEERANVVGFGGWSTKAGIYHVQPPVQILSKMLTFRIHLDDTGADNGPLLVAPGSHKLGRIPSNEVARVVSGLPVEECLVKAGDALMFYPLLCHCSNKAKNASSRLTIHLEYCSAELPAPLQWSSAA